ncbi:unnamed protein product [Owenia fusiformis]|uniref:Death domain-containing protein n=1 Tax=Owenia fusiformis TaxID=6347 RepID=A0A8S4QAE5_OWEFU|nr:unnamed protein product [Owenia fusiformis]
MNKTFTKAQFKDPQVYSMRMLSANFLNILILDSPPWNKIWFDIDLDDTQFGKLASHFDLNKELDNIRSDYKHARGNWVPALLTKWLQRQEGDDATIWKKFVEGLRHVGHGGLIGTLKKKYNIQYADK